MILNCHNNYTETLIITKYGWNPFQLIMEFYTFQGTFYQQLNYTTI